VNAVEPRVAADGACAPPLNARSLDGRGIIMDGETLASQVMALVSRGVREPPCSDADVLAVEARLGITLPADVRRFYRAMDGTNDMTDGHGLVRFWALREWNFVKLELPNDPSIFPIGNAVIFADHSCWATAYAAWFPERGSDRMEIFMLEGYESPMASSFSEFVQLVLADDSRVYGGAGQPGVAADGAAPRS
jgi:hypothetical protein